MALVVVGLWSAPPRAGAQQAGAGGHAQPQVEPQDNAQQAQASAANQTQADPQSQVQAATRADAQDPQAHRFDLNEFVVRGNTVLPQRDVEAVVYPHMGPQRTLADAQAARDALTRLYQDRGYQSVVVELPEQRVVGGSIVLQVSEAKIGRVKVVGAQHYSPLAVRDGVPALAEGKVPNFSQAQTQLTRLNQDPNRQVVPLLRPGKVVGTLDLDLKVDDQSPWRANVGLSNDYSADTEELRAIASVGHDNLWQAGHVASLTYFTAPEATDQVSVWSGSYLAPLLGSDWSLQLAGYSSDSNVATVGSSTTVLGKGTTVGLSAIRRFPPSGTWASTLSLGIDYKDTDQIVEFGPGTEVDEAPIRYLPITVAWNGYRAGERITDLLNLTLTGAFRGTGSDDAAFDNLHIMASSSYLAFKADWKRTFTLASDWQLVGRVAGQLASGSLISSEQYALGGAHTVRGYLSAEATGDDGFVLGMEAHTPLLAQGIGWLDEWRGYAFAEGGMIWVAKSLPEQIDEFSLSSIGIGMRWRIAKYFSGNIDWAFPLQEGPNTDNGSSRVLFNMRAGF